METTDLTTIILQNIRDDIAKLDAKFESKYDKLDSKYDKLDSRFDKLEGRFDKLEGRFDKLTDRVNDMDTVLAAVHRNQQNLVTRNEFSSAVLVLHDRMDRMQAQLIESDLRSTTAHQETQATLNQIMVYLGGHGSLAARVDRCEQDIADIKERVF
jgi:chromosome segregation ATPase